MPPPYASRSDVFEYIERRHNPWMRRRRVKQGLCSLWLQPGNGRRMHQSLNINVLTAIDNVLHLAPLSNGKYPGPHSADDLRNA